MYITSVWPVRHRRNVGCTLHLPSYHDANLKNLFSAKNCCSCCCCWCRCCCYCIVTREREKHPKAFGVALSLLLPHQGLSTVWYHTVRSCHTETHMARISVPPKVCVPFFRSTVTATPPFGCPPLASPCSKARCSVRALSAQELDMNKKTPTQNSRTDV